MHVIRRIAGAAIWILAALGVVCALVWLATTLGFIQPLTVASGSMQPLIRTGDLLVDTRMPASEVRAGDIVTLRSNITHELVTHRVVSIDDTGSGTWTVRLKGDANTQVDPKPYATGAAIWHPVLTIPGLGQVVAVASRPGVVVPLLVALAALLALSLMSDDRSRRRSRSRHDDQTEPSTDHPAAAAQHDVDDVLAAPGPTEGGST